MRSVLSATLLFALTALTLILLRPLMPVDETRYVAAAWEMRIGGSIWVPHLNGALYGQAAIAVLADQSGLDPGRHWPIIMSELQSRWG